MKLFVITFIVVFQLQTGWAQEESVIVAEKVEEDSEKKEGQETEQGESSIVSTNIKPVEEKKKENKEKKTTKIDDFSLPSLNLFPLLDPSATSKLPPLPVGVHTPPAKKYVNGRLVITRVPRPAVTKKPQMEMRKIKGKWVICLKN